MSYICSQRTRTPIRSPSFFVRASEIEFLLHGLDLGERFAPYAGWAVIGSGEVDESGERLVMLEGGMRTLGSVGVRRR
jgi:hypothetical protein